MKNVQIIDGADNCTFSIFQATDAEFALLFPEPEQDVQFSDDLEVLPDPTEVTKALTNVWSRPIRKQDAMGIHGTIFFGLNHYRDVFPGKQEVSAVASAINDAQRSLFGGCLG
ncbi:MAG: hypothetical protein KDJ36_02160 [Hyphomicrobiaceae bacterium]|nr:hypothetical protein [Hyphomicrobiaceae bacterium]